MFGATDLDTGTDKVNPPKIIIILIQFARTEWKKREIQGKDEPWRYRFRIDAERHFSPVSGPEDILMGS